MEKLMTPMIVVMSVAASILVGVLIGRLTSGKLGPVSFGKGLGLFVAVASLIVVGAGYLIFSVTKGTADAEIQMGLVVVAAIATMMTLLFVLAAGFSAMNLADGKQPLGLPEGSIRAMISLVLIMVFIIFGIYLFRIVGTGSSTFAGVYPTLPDPKSFGEKKTMNFQKNSDGTYDVWLIGEISDDGKRLAQQLVTTVGTLVVAVAGFYFGSTTMSSATAAAAASSGSSPVVSRVTPDQSPKGKEITLEISGAGFKAPKAVRLTRGNETMSASDILSSATKIRAVLRVDKEPDGKWDLVVDNDDGKEARLAGAFTISAA
jgi:hypothetical protein